MKRFAKLAIAVVALASVPALANDKPLCEREPASFQQWFYKMFYC